MAILFGGSRVNSKTPPATSLRVQTSLNGQPIAIVQGRQRVACNLLDYEGLEYHAASNSGKGGGKGGLAGGGKSGSGQSYYTVDIVAGLCEGPITDIGAVWASQSVESMAYLAGGASWEAGAPGQAAPGWMTTNYPNHAIGYSWLATMNATGLNLGGSAALPNLNFEVTGAIAGAVAETNAVTSPYAFTPAYFTLGASVTEQVTMIPPSPYEVRAQNPYAATLALVQGGQGGYLNGNDIPGTASQGVIDANGRVFTRVSGTPSTGEYVLTIVGNSGNGGYVIYTFAAADAGLQVTIIDFAVSPGVHYCYRPTGDLAAGSALVSSLSSTTSLAVGQRVIAAGIPAGTVIQSIGSGTINLSEPATLTASGASLTILGAALTQMVGTPAAGQFSLSVQPGAFGQYLFAAADNGADVYILDVPDADPAAALADFLANPRYGAGFPAANLGDLTTLEDYAYAAGLFISPALTTAQAANSYLNDFSTGLNGEFVWSAGLLTFVPYGDTAISGYGKSHTPPTAPLYTIDDDDFLKNEGTASVGVSAFTSDDPVVCVRQRPSDAMNDVKIEYLDRGNSYNPAIAEAKDDAAINAYGLRAADTQQLHFFCDAAAAMMTAQLQLGRQQVRNLYSFTVPWYFILLDPMDIIAISDAALGLDEAWVRIREITENQEDGSLTITAEDYLPGTGWAAAIPTQPSLGAVANSGAAPAGVN
ncbi:MAG: phage tail protein [Stellaceae bacterium]